MSRLNSLKNELKIQELTNFIAKYQIDLVINSLLPKFLFTFENKHKKLWENFFNKTLPKHNLGFKNDIEYLEEYNLTKEQIIENSITSIFPNLDNYDLKSLKEYFELFSINNKLKIYHQDNKPIAVYIEIVESLIYIEQMQVIISKFPKSDGNHLGTKHRQSSLKKLIKTQLNILEHRLDNQFFPLSNKDEIKKTKFQIKFIEHSLKDKYKNLPEWLNYIKINIGFKNTSLKTNEIEVEALSQLTTFFNGIKSSSEELVKSVTIMLRNKSNISKEEEKLHKKLSEDIFNITLYFFQNEIKTFEYAKKKRTFTYSAKNIQKEYVVKTFLYETPIFTYVNKSTKDPLSELMEIGFNSILGIQNIFEEDNPTLEGISNIRIIRNLLAFLKEMNITKEEIRALFHILKNTQKIQINQEQKLPLDNLKKSLPLV